MSNVIERAKDFALGKHGSQLYGGIYPYSYHLQSVVDILVEFNYGNDSCLLAAGWLHDALEDTNATSHEIFCLYPNSLKLVNLIVGISSTKGLNRKQRIIETAYNINVRNVGEWSSSLIALKLADRIANTRFSATNKQGKYWKMYEHEYSFFRAALDNSKTASFRTDIMWQELDKLMGS